MCILLLYPTSVDRLHLDMQQTTLAPTKNMSPRRASSIHDLPLKIMTYIFTLMSVETLVRCRYISRSWFSLISNINFIKAHLRKSSQLSNFSRRRQILESCRPFVNSSNCYSYYLKSSPIESIFYSRIDDDKLVELDYQLNDHNTCMSIVGSYDGLVCIYIGNRDIMLWNPSTRESKKLPALDERQQITGSMFGFGYDQLNDDYKVVMTKFFDSRGQRVNGVMVYSLRTNLWRNIEDFQPTYRYRPRGVFVNGVLHWEVMVPSGGFSWSEKIVSLDLEDETYGEIAQPNLNATHGDFRWSLASLEECLSICYYSVGICIDIWVMKEYGVRDSWMKMHTIRNVIVPEEFYHFRCFPLCISMMGEIFFKYRDGFVRYDPNGGTFKKSMIHCMSMPDHEPITYVESLVSPNMYNEVYLHKGASVSLIHDMSLLSLSGIDLF